MIFTISRAADSREPVGLLSVPRDYSLSYSIQFPTYADLCQRYAVTGINSTIHDFLVYRNDSSFTPSSSTHPRTERRTLPDFTLGSGLLQFQADFMTSCATSSVAIFQVKLGGPTVKVGDAACLMLWVYKENLTVNGNLKSHIFGRVCDHFHHLNINYDSRSGITEIWIDSVFVYRTKTSCVSDFQR